MDILEQIRKQVESNPIILYMKGSPQFPMCGFSGRTVEALKQCGEEFAYIDVLIHPEIRSNLPKFSDWPTFPQLFIKGELIGGCDITLELFESGELQKMVKQAVNG
ncbi:MAG: Grx4 family monothiol glutaredoxin [Gammaproteobacteria bacterium]|nr:Grx4 family monothiol glutaredoxin [Gammaproteobacteria bacterium]